MNREINIFEKEFIKQRDKYPLFKPGDTVKVVCEYDDGVKKTLQSFEGTVIQRRHPNTNGETFTVRRISEGVAVEKIFPLLSQTIKEIEVVKVGIVHRARIFYIRNQKGKDAKIKTKFVKKELKKDIEEAKESNQEKTEIITESNE